MRLAQIIARLAELKRENDNPETTAERLAEISSEITTLTAEKSAIESSPAPAPIVVGNDDASRELAVQAERQRTSEITALCRDFNVDPTTHITSGVAVDAVRAAILTQIREERAASPSGIPNISVERDEADKVRAAASDAILLRGGIRIEKPADGARDMRGMKLRDLAIDCLSRAGVANAQRLDNDEMFRRALTPDSQFTSILSDSVNKSMATAYRASVPTYRAWTGIGSNPDFKANTHYQISEAGELKKMSQEGEFKFDEMQDSGVSKAVATFGISFGITRQAMVNDDIGVLTRIPEAYVRAAGRGINKLVYQMIGSNPAIYDGQDLFGVAHKNLGTGGAISRITVGEARKLMRTQKNVRGLETLNIAPKFMIVPASLETDGQVFLTSPADKDGAHAGINNIFRSSLDLVVDAELDAYGEASYYFAASPADIDTVEVTFLNGDDMPKLESQVGFDFLGMKWRIYIDYGVTVLDYRGLVKNAGPSEN